MAQGLASSDPEARRLAAQALASDDRDEAASLIARALADEDWRVRKEAALSAKASPRRAEVLGALLAGLGDRDDVGLRNSAVEALVAIGPEAVPTAITALRTLDADGRKLAIEVLGGVPDARGAEALASALADEDPNVRQSAAEALGTSALAGEDARKTALRALGGVLSRSGKVEGDSMLTLAALGALTRIGATLQWSVLAPLAAEPLLRSAALAACAKSTDPACGEALAEAVLDPSPAIARAAVSSLAEWIAGAMQRGAPVDAIVARLQARDGGARVRALDDVSDPHAHGAALTLLALLGDAEAAPAIVRALLDPMLARSAERAASLLGSAALPALLAVGEREPPSRHAALLLVVPTLASALDDRALAVVRATLGHEDGEVAAAAAQVLAALGEGDDIERLAVVASRSGGSAARSAALAIEALAAKYSNEALAAFERFANDPSRTLAACVLLTALRAAPPSSIEYLARALGGGDAETRRAAIEALAAIGGAEAREMVAGTLADEDRAVQLAAVRALGVLRHGGALSELVASVSDAEILAAAASALAEADPVRALAVCSDLVAREDPAIASAAASVLGRFGARGEAGLVRALAHASDEIVKLALSELGRAPSPSAIEHVARTLEHPSWEVRRLAAEVLGAEGGEQAVAALRARLEHEEDASVREAIMLSLASGDPWGGTAPT